jgi:hypothetical protein
MHLVQVWLLVLTWGAIIQGGEWTHKDKEKLKSLKIKIDQIELGKEKQFLRRNEKDVQNETQATGLTKEQLLNSIKMSKDVIYNLEKRGS